MEHICGIHDKWYKYAYIFIYLLLYFASGSLKEWEKNRALPYKVAVSICTQVLI